MSDRNEPLFEIGPYVGRQARDQGFYYVEVGANGEDMNVSELYGTKEHAEEGAQAALDRAREE